MEEKKLTLEQVPQTMEDTLGEEPRPMVLMSKIAPEIVFRHAQDREFVLDLPNIPSKYKQLIYRPPPGRQQSGSVRFRWKSLINSHR